MRALVGAENDGPRITDEQIARLTAQVRSLEERKQRAQARLATQTDPPSWYFGILNLEADTDSCELLPNGGIRLQRVAEPPREMELYQALKRKSLAMAVSRYAHAAHFELVLTRREDGQQAPDVTLAWLVIATLRIRTRIDILVPIFANHSWSVIAGLPPDSCEAGMLEDVPLAHLLKRALRIASDDIDWIRQHLGHTVVYWGEDQRFRMAVEAFCTHQHQSNLRMAAATLWAGIEALFGINAELRFRLAAYVATSLEPRGESRVQLFRRTQKLYDVRSKAVHGGALEDSALREHVLEVGELLARLLVRFIEERAIPSRADLDVALFS